VDLAPTVRRLKTYVSILFMVILYPLGDVLLRKGMQDLAVPVQWTGVEMAATTARVFSSATIWLGVACLIAYLLAEMLVLSWADYSYVQPTSAVAYGVVALMGHFILGEEVSLTRWLGVFIICLGVLIVGRTSPHTTETRSS
jgi:drug/metabolite transporter (DMT)-like permease